MWAQLITVRVKEGGAEEVQRIMDVLRDAEIAGSGIVRQIVTRDQADPQVIRTIAIFESEEKARARDIDPRRAEASGRAHAMLAAIVDGPPTFNDLEVIWEQSY